MPHVIVKLWPGQSDEQKRRLAQEIAKDVMNVLNYGDESLSVAMEEVEPRGVGREGLSAGHRGERRASFVISHALVVDGGYTIH